MCITLLTGTSTVGCLVDTTENVRGFRITCIGIQDILTVLEGHESIGNPFLGKRIYEAMSISTTSEGTVRIAVETLIALLVENKDDTLIAQIGNLINGDAVIGSHGFTVVHTYILSVLVFFCSKLGNIVQTIDSLEGLPHTGIVHIVEYRISVLCRTATLEVHTTDILTTLYPTS